MDCGNNKYKMEDPDELFGYMWLKPISIGFMLTM